eukprot:scaffold328379_cov59-Tisochrysis_lutea.AAC.4
MPQRCWALGTGDKAWATRLVFPAPLDANQLCTSRHGTSTTASPGQGFPRARIHPLGHGDRLESAHDLPFFVVSICLIFPRPFRRHPPIQIERVFVTVYFGESATTRARPTSRAHPCCSEPTRNCNYDAPYPWYDDGSVRDIKNSRCGLPALGALEEHAALKSTETSDF